MGSPGPSVYKSDVVAKQKYAVRRLAKKNKVKCPCVLRVGLCVCVLAFMCVSLFCCCCWFCGAVCVYVLLACVFIVFGGLCLLVFWVCCWWSTCSAAGGAAAGFVGLCVC